jgi:hypothetical protein
MEIRCWSYVGMNGNGAQDVSLPDYCVSSNYPGSVIHELMHATGFQHEHQRPDQQYYINVNYPNIRPGIYFLLSN